MIQAITSLSILYLRGILLLRDAPGDTNAGAIKRTYGFVQRLKIRSAKADINIERRIYRDIGDI